MKSTRRACALWCSLLIAGCGGGDPAGTTGSAPPDAGKGPGSAYLFDLDLLHRFEVEVAPADWAQIRADPRAETYVPATLVFEGSRIPAQLRFKGGYGTLESCFDETGAPRCPKLSYKLKFNGVRGGRFAGLRKLNFHSSVRDASLMHEVISYHLFRTMGVPAPRASHALLTINGEDLGLFVLVEQIDEEFLEDHYASDAGNLYKAIWPRYHTAEPYLQALQTNENAPNVSRMIALANTIATATDQRFVASVAGELDLPALARFLAVDQAVGNDDGPRRFYCYGPGTAQCENGNYYWYDEPSSSFHLIPWDVDDTLAEVNRDLGRAAYANSASCEPIPYCDYYMIEPCELTEPISILPEQCDPLIGMVQRAVWPAYLDALAELAVGPMSPARLDPLIAAVRTKIRSAVAADPFGPGLALFDERNSWLDQTIAEQRDEIARLLAGQRD